MPTVPVASRSQLTKGQDPMIQRVTGETDPVAIMAKLREMKNNFK